MQCSITYPDDFKKPVLPKELVRYFGLDDENTTINIMFNADVRYTITMLGLRTNLEVSLAGVSIVDRLNKKTINRIKKDLDIL